MSDVIAGAAMRCKTMADGSLRIEIEVEPRDALAAFTLFGKVGAPVALAALREGYAAPDTEPEPERPKGGPLCRLAAQWCGNSDFLNWLQQEMPHLWEDCALSVSSGEPDEIAAQVIRTYCGIVSRSELDHNEEARALFDEGFRRPFGAYLREVSRLPEEALR